MGHPVGAGQRFVGQPWWSYGRPVQVAVAEDVFHLCQVGVVLAQRGPGQRGKQVPHEEPVARVCVGGFGWAGEGTVPMGPALTTMMRRAPVAFIAAAMARVPWVATPASEFDVAPSPESTASAPSTADSSDAGSGAASPDLSQGLMAAAGRRGGRFLDLDFRPGV